VDSAWEQEKLEAGKMLVNRAESPASGAPQKMGEPSFYTRETGAQFPLKVYSEKASTQAPLWAKQWRKFVFLLIQYVCF